MVYYLKINRKEEYTFPNLQKWMDVISSIPESKIYIICDELGLEDAVRNRVSHDQEIEFIESERTDPEVQSIIKGFSNERWENAGYAHITTFYHARQNGFDRFWNIDADDTFICLPHGRVVELLTNVEKKAVTDQIPLLSLDMWYSKSCVKHWTFGISFTDNSLDWFSIMRDHLKDENYLGGAYPPNMDGYFSYLRGLTGDLRIDSFYAENLRFLHYSNDFFRRPWASGFYHWKDGKLSFPILRDCFGIDNLGTVVIPDEVIRIDIGITDEEAQRILIENCYKADRRDVEIRISDGAH